MKKSFALILCLVFVISIALVTCVAFIPMNVTQVADAEVNTIDAGALYTLAKSTSLSFSTTTELVCDFYAKPAGSIIPTNPAEYTHITCIRYVIGPASYRYVYFKQFSSTDTDGDFFYRVNSGLAIRENGSYNGTSYSNYDIYLGGYVDDLGMDSSITDNITALTGFKSGLTLRNPNFFGASSAPLFADNFASFAINYRFGAFSGSPYTADYIFPSLILFPPGDGSYRVGQFAYQLVGVEVSNASSFIGDFTYLGVTYEDCCPIYYKSYYDGGYFYGYSICSLVGDTYFLFMALPAGFDNLQLYFGIDANGVQITDFSDVESTYINSASTNSLLLTIYHTFLANYRKLSESDVFELEYDRGYYVGYDAGQQNENNNLVDVIWATFMMPIKILFGTFNSSTNTYDGGLFNFTILGLDIRAFVLSIMSVCLIIACIKIVLGLRGGSNG